MCFLLTICIGVISYHRKDTNLSFDAFILKYAFLIEVEGKPTKMICALIPVRSSLSNTKKKEMFALKLCTKRDFLWLLYRPYVIPA